MVLSSAFLQQHMTHCNTDGHHIHVLRLSSENTSWSWNEQFDKAAEVSKSALNTANLPSLVCLHLMVIHIHNAIFAGDKTLLENAKIAALSDTFAQVLTVVALTVRGEDLNPKAAESDSTRERLSSTTGFPPGFTDHDVSVSGKTPGLSEAW